MEQACGFALSVSAADAAGLFSGARPAFGRYTIVLLAASLLFYAMGQPVYVLLLVGLSYESRHV